MTPSSTELEFQLYNATFDYYLYVIIGGKFREVFKRRKDLVVRFSPEELGAVITNKVRDHIMWFYHAPCPALLAHEATHSVQHIMSLHDITLGDETEEVFACLMEWTVRETWRELSTNGKTNFWSAPPARPQLIATLSQKKDL